MPLNLDEIRQALPARTIFWNTLIDSTMHEGIRLAEEGAPSGTVVGADEQTAGQGRFGRTWHSRRDDGLYFTIVLRLAIEGADIPVVTFALGLAVWEAIQQTAGIQCDLRWPNDLVIGHRKCAGILTQLHGKAIVSGIGINVNQGEFPPDVAGIATSLMIESGKPQSREALLVSVLECIDRNCELLIERGREAIFSLYTHASSYACGRRVQVDLPDGTVAGVTAGLTPLGYLRLRRDDGGEEIIVAGGVRPAEF